MVLLRNALHARGVPEKLIVYIASLASDGIHDVPEEDAAAAEGS